MPKTGRSRGKLEELDALRKYSTNSVTPMASRYLKNKRVTKYFRPEMINQFYSRYKCGEIDVFPLTANSKLLDVGFDVPLI